MTTKKEYEQIDKMFANVDSINRLRECREANGYSQRQVAELLNTSQQNIALYENGERTPKVDLIVKLADLYSVSIYYLLGLSNVKSCDMEFQGVCEYIGLSGRAVNNLLFSKSLVDQFGNSYCNAALNHLMERSEFREFSMHLFSLYSIYMRSKQYSNDSVNTPKDIDIIKDFHQNSEVENARQILSEFGYTAITNSGCFDLYLQRASLVLQEAFQDWAKEISNQYRYFAFGIDDLEDGDDR
ncbi:MAG: helix-turn-helix transcriptional regulator [Oscillospiraceae bacterium]|nr:helix-turn-helix transcriptional regulator [Oscillospiraceae bacterium]